jgi:hypothetical protein
VLKSPALDALGRVYIGTRSGVFYKLRLNADGSVTTLWQTPLGEAISSSPVIDRDGYIYVGDEQGNLHKLDPISGAVVWVYNSGAAIRSTPSISEYRVVYFANMNGLVTALSTEKEVKWKYQSDGPVSANILYVDRMLYIANEKGKYIAIYDNPNSVTVNISPNERMPDLKDQFKMGANNASQNGLIIDEIPPAEANTTLETVPESIPMWGTFQGDYRRTGNLSSGCPLSITVTKETDGSLLSNVGTSIQWYKNDDIIDGATSSSYKPTQSGTYSVKNTSLTCSIIESNKYELLITSVTNLSLGEEMSIFPNPFDAQVNVNFRLNGVTVINLRVVEMSTGKVIKVYEKLRSGQILNVSDIPKGTYIFQCVTPDGRLFKAYKMMKFK